MPLSCSYLSLLSGLLLFLAFQSTAVGQPEALTSGRTGGAVVRPDGPATGLFNVVAVRIEFEPDTSRFTSGTGVFAGDPYGGIVPRIDPLPHDAAFFEAHLEALSHYVESVSDGRANLNTILLPGVYRVSRRMGDYAPVGLDASSDAELSKLASLVGEGWNAAGAAATSELASLDPDRTFFVIFHAGVGRDIELVGTTLEKTPLDLPSIFFSEAKLAQLGVSGLSVGGLDVRNTAIIPRTETRRGFDYFSDSYYLAELTTNGLLAASFLNFLGVPDLFDTQTGRSAIGPFGLMDPLGIFAFAGLLPPEPSAWTKLFLGWADTVEVNGGDNIDLSLTAASDRETSDVARVWISASEYFLVENRNRDIDRDGLHLTIWNHGQITQQSVENGDPLFNSVTVEGFDGGVLVAADDYDWSLPGGLDQDGNDLLGGALIWHVDERLIADRIASNTVNAFPKDRGVDLEEADSGQDLGQEFPGLLGPQLNLGSPFDFFYEGNPVTAITPSGDVSLYRNRFASDTFPDSRTNQGGPSFVSLQDFSPPGREMTFSVRWEGEGDIDLLPGWPVDVSSTVGEDVLVVGEKRALTACGAGEDAYLAVPFDSGDESAHGLSIIFGGGASVFYPPGLQETKYACVDGSLLLLAGSENLTLMRLDPLGPEWTEWSLPMPVGAALPPSRIVVDGSRVILVFLSGDQTDFITVDLVTNSVTSATVDVAAAAWGFAGSDAIALGTPGRVDVYSLDGALRTGESSGWTLTGGNTTLVGNAVFGRDVGELVGASALADGRVLLFGSDGQVRVVDIERDFGLGSVTGSDPVIADLDGDGRLDVLVVAGRRLVGLSQGGAVVAGFPIDLRAPLVGQPLVVKGQEETSVSVVAATTDGYVYAYDMENGGRLEPGFPLAVGGRIEATPTVDEISEDAAIPATVRLYAVSTAGEVAAWAIKRYVGADWPGRYGKDNQGFRELSSPSPSDEIGPLLVRSETYNWPNPVTEDRTHFRFLAAEDCSVRITIVDAAGTVIDELDAPAIQGGTPAELTWATSVVSGLYFARVRARTPAGRTDDVVVKLAVIR